MSPRGARAQSQTPVVGGRLTYLEPQAHTNLYPPADGFYPNGGVLNQITDKLTYQNPNTPKIEPWLAESWSFNPERTEYVFKLRKGATFSDGAPLASALCFPASHRRNAPTTSSTQDTLRNEAIMRHI